ncbi:hypothetical protein ACIA8G_04390 [Lentzea sp. NPDC051213]|uniref:hypothetical protein n=1 Tax=Lentzea sp. NPDC051213 TaxID=3364126 RepID=UPI0037ADF125
MTITEHHHQTASDKGCPPFHATGSLPLDVSVRRVRAQLIGEPELAAGVTLILSPVLDVLTILVPSASPR